MPPYLIFSILALIFFSASIIAFKLTAKHFMPNPYAYFFYYFLIYFVLGLFLPLFKPIEIIPTNIKQLSYIWPYAITIFIGMYCFSFSIFKLDVTTMAPLGNLTNVFTPILAALFLGEKILSKNYPLFLLVILAGFLASYDEKLKIRSFFNKYIYLFLVFIFSISLTKIFANKGINAIGYWNFTFYELFYGSVGLLFFLPFIYKKINVGLKPVLFFIPGIIFEFFALLAVLKAFSYQVIIPTIVISIPLASIVTFIISRFNKKLLEYHPLETYAVRFIGIFIMTLGLIILGSR